jgi:hypothetical protein
VSFYDGIRPDRRRTHRYGCRSLGCLNSRRPINLTNPATGTKFDTVTTGTGNYTLPTVPVGSYTLTADHAGFREYNETNVQVKLATTTRVDVVLKVGTANESVQVTSQSTLLKSENAEQETTLSDKQIAELLINFGEALQIQEFATETRE